MDEPIRYNRHRHDKIYITDRHGNVIRCELRIGISIASKMTVRSVGIEV